MNRNPKKPSARGGGVFLVLAILGGTILGGLAGQPTIGFLVGTAAGTLIALLLWLADLRR